MNLRSKKHEFIYNIRNVIRKAINRNQKPDAKLHSNQQQSTKHCVFFKLQFIDRISMQNEKEIRGFLCAHDIKLIMSHRNFTIGKLFPYKDRQSLLHSSGVAYQLTCSYGQNVLAKPNGTQLLASMSIARKKTLKFANICSIIPTTKLILTHPKFWTEVIT